MASTVALIFTLLGLPGCGRENLGRGDQTNALVAGNNAFALELYGRLKSTNDNLFFSPFSISSSLATTHAGARGNTERQIAQTLHFGTDQVLSEFGELNQILNRSQRGIELSIANGLWVQKGHPFLPTFINSFQKQLHATVQQFDSEAEAESARVSINAWVSEKTKGQIKEVIPADMLGRDPRLVSVSAIYFKGVWQTKFDAKNTRPGVFYLDDGRKVECPMMVCSGEFRLGFHSAPDLSCDLLELPYASGDVSLIAILPTDLEKLEANLTGTNLSTLLASMRETSAQVMLPKLKFSAAYDLEEPLSAMGITDAFNANANFSGIDGTRSLFISSIQHHASMEIDEEGTTAVATSTTHYNLRGGSPKFWADHPFLFLIRDNRSGSILFLGRVMDPTKQPS